MANSQDSQGNSIGNIQPFMEAYGSVRLRNCIAIAIAEGRMPFTTLEQYLSSPLESRLAKLRLIPNLGAKTAHEFDRLVEQYFEADGVVEEGTESTTTAVAGDICDQEVSIEPPHWTPTSEDRYSNLTPREKDVLERHFAIGRDQKQTLEEIGKEYDVTRERIRQIEKKALGKLRSSRIAQCWQLFIEEKMSALLDVVFNSRPVIKRPPRVTGELGLAIAVVYGSARKFLEQTAERSENGWVNPDLDFLELQSTRNRLAPFVRDSAALPASVAEVAQHLEVSSNLVRAAIADLLGVKIFNGWIISGNATKRKQRIVNILNLFQDHVVKSPASLWDLKVAYWSRYDDKCSGRDLLLCLQDHRRHFRNLRELGWLYLNSELRQNGQGSEILRSSQPIPEELYAKPVKSGRGLANCVYWMFEKHGPQRLADAAELFKKEYPKYAVSSMYPMLVYFAVFLRFAPGVVGIQAHCRDPDAVQRARELLLRNQDVDLYLLSRAAGPPKLRYPLWDHEMEFLWAKWLEQKKDFSRLGALLSVAGIDDWDVDELAKAQWANNKEKYDNIIAAPVIRNFAERQVDSRMLTTALAAASILGFVNWMYLNQALGWRIETSRVALVLALLIRINAIKSTGTWSEPHLLTKRGRQISKSIFSRPMPGSTENRKTILDFLEEWTDGESDFGWAEAYSLDQLMKQVSDISGSTDLASSSSEEEAVIEAAYEGFMGDQLRRLIESD